MSPHTAQVLRSFSISALPRNANLEWFRVLVGFGLLAAIWFHHWLSIIAALVVLTGTARWRPPERHPERWMTRAIDGYRIWMERLETSRLYAMYGAGMVLSVAIVWVLWTNNVVMTAIILGGTIVLKGWFLTRLVGVASKKA